MASVKEPIQVYCRLRPVNDDETPCMKVVSPSTVQISPPETAINYQNGYMRDTQYKFSFVFDDDASQKTVFDNVAMPLVDGLLHGKNGLLFTYGITGSRKTYTMIGPPKESGILPRALDVIFNSIAHLQSKKYVFKPDRLNGFDIQSEEDAKMDGLNEIRSQVSSKTTRKYLRQESEWLNRISEDAKIDDIYEDNMYAVFVTYIEIYNNSVFDLLDENLEELSSRGRGPQSKLVREDGAKNMYVHGVTEVEVKCTDDAFEVFNRGLCRRRMAHNTLNAESSRSHSVFTVRVVQAPLDVCGETVLQDKRRISISQLSFVDLAGSERTSRTNTTGQRLREAGNINNSLMTLRTCLEVLRENQATGTNKLVPYRDSKLTHLFKNFFDGECIVRVIVCVNPRSEDYNENLHVMKFAEMSQEVQVVKPTPLCNIDNLSAGRRRANQIFKRAMANLNEANNENIPIEVGVNAVYSLASQFPDMCLMEPEDDRLNKNLMTFLGVEIAKRKKLNLELEGKEKQFCDILIKSEEQMMRLKHHNSVLSSEVTSYKEKICSLESQIAKIDVAKSSLKKQNSEYRRVIKRLQEEIEIKNRESKLKQVKRILSDETPKSPTPWSLDVPSTYNLRTPSTDSLAIPSTVTVRRRRATPYRSPAPSSQSRSPAVRNPRYRRSRSVGEERWLEHRPRNPVPLNTVMQPRLPRCKSITELTDPSDLTQRERYCLLTQQQDSDGETCIYKGDVVPSCSGGAQVVLNDFEILKQKSPQNSPTRKRSGNGGQENVEDKCSVSIEGHAKRSKH